MRMEQIGLLIMVVSGMSHLAIILTSNVVLRFVCFLVFEACVGLYFPMMGTLKGKVVPEQMRSTIYNLYRLPLNVIVVLVLVTHLDTNTSFMVTSALLVVAAFAQHKLMNSSD